jgi:hypothetical protein
VNVSKGDCRLQLATAIQLLDLLPAVHVRRKDRERFLMLQFFKNPIQKADQLEVGYEISLSV